MKRALIALIAALAGPLFVLHAVAAAPTQKPNIVLIVADDLGYGDVGSYGALKVKTPNIDRLADEGVRLTDAHVAATICQPSRYTILSGTYPMRAQRQGKLTLYFHHGQITLPSLLKSAGYRTAAIGKWHLGFGRGAEPDFNAELKPGPLEVGFDYFFGLPRSHNEPPFVFVENHHVFDFDPQDPIRMISPAEVAQRGLKDWGWGLSEGAQRAHAARPQDRIDLILAEKAVQFISKASDQPLFLYLAFVSPHVPIAPAQEFKGTSQAGHYGDFVQQLDAAVGIVLEALETQGLADNTLVIFTSDNGAVLHIDTLESTGHRANGTLLGQKTDAWEGGHRVPFIARWPGRIPAGSKATQLFGMSDIMATLAAVAGVDVPKKAAPDSVNQLSVLTDPADAPAVRTELLTMGLVYGGYALRQEEWLYLPNQGSSGTTAPAKPKPSANGNQDYARLGFVTSDINKKGRIKGDAPPTQLYNLDIDFSQRWNLAINYPERTEMLEKRLREITRKPEWTVPYKLKP